MKAWNVYNVSSEKEIYFWVSDQQTPSLQLVKNIPNPLRTDTKFVFSSANVTGDVDVQILIYSFTVQLVKTISKKIFETAGEVQVIPWDGSGESGMYLSNGIYPYRIVLKGSNGNFAQASQKVLIMR
jgi:flagellar hook assembly protein FlgD